MKKFRKSKKIKAPKVKKPINKKKMFRNGFLIALVIGGLYAFTVFFSLSESYVVEDSAPGLTSERRLEFYNDGRVEMVENIERAFSLIMTVYTTETEENVFEVDTSKGLDFRAVSFGKVLKEIMEEEPVFEDFEFVNNLHRSTLHGHLTADETEVIDIDLESLVFTKTDDGILFLDELFTKK